MAWLIPIFGIIALILDALALKCLWRWFVMPTIGVQPLTFACAIGFILIAAVILPYGVSDCDGDELNAEIYRKLFGSIAVALFAIIVGYLTKCLIPF